MDKFDFIKSLLSDKKLKPQQREKIIELAHKEIQNNADLEKRLEEIEKLVYKKNNDDSNEPTTNLPGDIDGNGETPDPPTKSLPKYIDPALSYRFLYEYNQNPVLKSTCHEIDGDELEVIKEYCESETYEFELHLPKIIEAYNEHENSYYTPYSVKAMIRGYLTGKDRDGNDLKKGWSTDGIIYHWSHEEVLKYTVLNKNTPPNLSRDLLRNNKTRPCAIEQTTSVITGKTIQTFRELVLHFKNLFHIKSDNSLHSMIQKMNDVKEWNQSVDFTISDMDFPHNIELFTDVDKVLQAYIKLIELIIEQSKIIDEDQKPKVRLKLSQEGSAVYFSIHHLNSIYRKSLQDTVERLGQTYTNLIKRQINGVCNLYLNADFGNAQYANVNIWNGNARSQKTLNNFEGGVEHILEFQKKLRNDLPN